MVKAVQAGRHNRVKALQWLLTHSFSGRVDSVKQHVRSQTAQAPASMVVARLPPQSEISTQSTPPALREPQPRLAQAQTLRPTAISLLASFIFQFGHWSVSHDIIGPLGGGTPTAIMQAER